jgi:hypothetical protein
MVAQAFSFEVLGRPRQEDLKLEKGKKERKRERGREGRKKERVEGEKEEKR